MNRILTAATAALVMQTITAQSVCHELPQPRAAVSCAIDSIDRREDLTRVYCTFAGQPHTSDRIDSVTLVTVTRRLPATDIDGVDFKRYFQWEDDGNIRLEIDFGPADAADGDTVGWQMLFDTVHGTVTSTADK